MHRVLLRGACGLLGTALLLIGCGGDGPVEPTPVPSCTYAVSPTGAQAPADGQTLTIHLAAGPACAWNARSDVSWITLSSTSGSGAADVVVTVAANATNTNRSGNLTIADQQIIIQQAGRITPSCTYALRSPSSTFGPEGGKGHVTIDTAAGCAWTASSSASWITVRTLSGSGPGDIEYDVSTYAGTDQRSAQILAGGTSFAVRQDPPPSAPCTYGVDPTSVSLHWHGVAGDGMEVRLTTLGHCSWTAAPGAAWVELLTATSGSGSAAMRVRINAYTNETTRSAPLMIRWPTPTAGQNVSFTQEGCRYALSVRTDDVPVGGGVRRRVSVFGDPVTVDCMVGCPWTIVNVAPWVHISGSTTRAGDDDVFYDVDPNTTGSQRTAAIAIGPLTLTVVQGG